MILKRIQQETFSSNQRFSVLRNELDILQEHLGAVRNMYESNIARMGMTTYMCLTIKF